MVTPPVQPLRLSIACLLICLSSARVTAVQWSLDTPKDETLIVHGEVQDAFGIKPFLVQRGSFQGVAKCYD